MFYTRCIYNIDGIKHMVILMQFFQVAVKIICNK